MRVLIFLGIKTKFNTSPKTTMGGFNQSSSSTTGGKNTATATQEEPNVDFEFHVSVRIKSGKCMLHTDRKPGKIVKDRSFSGNIFGESPDNQRKMKTNFSSSRLRGSERPQVGGVQDVTTFFIPGLDVRAHYTSKTEIEETLSFDCSGRDGSWLSSTKRMGNKKATLSTWMTLQSIPEETIITPHILDFLEQALQPLPTYSSDQMSSVKDSEEDEEIYEVSSSGGSQTALTQGTIPSSFSCGCPLFTFTCKARHSASHAPQSVGWSAC